MKVQTSIIWCICQLAYTKDHLIAGETFRFNMSDPDLLRYEDQRKP